MEHLYLDGYIKKAKLGQALHYAKIHNRLPQVEESEVRVFLENFDKITTQRHGDFLDKIDHHEMGEIIKIMSMNHADILNERDLQTISSILLNKDFEF